MERKASHWGEERIEGQKKAKAMAKAARASRKALVKRAEEAAAEREKIKERHVADVKEWERAVQECQIHNLPKKQYPKKPIRTRKPKPNIPDIVPDDDDNESDDDNERP